MEKQSLSRRTLALLFHRHQFTSQNLSLSAQETATCFEIKADVDAAPYFLLLFAIHEIVDICPESGDEINTAIQLVIKALSEFASVYCKVKQEREEGILS